MVSYLQWLGHATCLGRRSSNYVNKTVDHLTDIRLLIVLIGLTRSLVRDQCCVGFVDVLHGV